MSPVPMSRKSWPVNRTFEKPVEIVVSVLSATASPDKIFEVYLTVAIAIVDESGPV